MNSFSPSANDPKFKLAVFSEASSYLSDYSLPSVNIKDLIDVVGARLKLNFKCRSEIEKVINLPSSNVETSQLKAYLRANEMNVASEVNNLAKKQTESTLEIAGKVPPTISENTSPCSIAMTKTEQMKGIILQDIREKKIVPMEYLENVYGKDVSNNLHFSLRTFVLNTFTLREVSYDETHSLVAAGQQVEVNEEKFENLLSNEFPEYCARIDLLALRFGVDALTCYKNTQTKQWYGFFAINDQLAYNVYRFEKEFDEKKIGELREALKSYPDKILIFDLLKRFVIPHLALQYYNEMSDKLLSLLTVKMLKKANIVNYKVSEDGKFVMRNSLSKDEDTSYQKYLRILKSF